MIVKASCQGQGIALGWHGLIDELLENAELIQLFQISVATEVGYFIEIRNTRKSKINLLVRDWVIEQAAVSAF